MEVLRNRAQAWSAIDQRVDEGQPSLVAEGRDRCNDQHQARRQRAPNHAPLARGKERKRKKNADLWLKSQQAEEDLG